MTRTQLLALRDQLTVDVPTAGRALNLGSNASYEAVRRGVFPVRVIKVGRKLRVPVADLLRELGIEPS